MNERLLFSLSAQSSSPQSQEEGAEERISNSLWRNSRPSTAMILSAGDSKIEARRTGSQLQQLSSLTA